MRVVLASTNRHKVEEFQRLFVGARLEVRAPAGWDLAPLVIEEAGRTFAANAITKARAYCTAYNMPALADDSGIRVDVLAGAPGIRSARFGSPDLDDAGRARYLLTSLTGIEEARRGANYVCALALALPGEPPIVVEGRWYGRVGHEYLAGGTGFGYDPVFMASSMGMPVSRLTPVQKDELGHRGKATRRLLSAISARNLAG